MTDASGEKTYGSIKIDFNDLTASLDAAGNGTAPGGASGGAVGGAASGAPSGRRGRSNLPQRPEAGVADAMIEAAQALAISSQAAASASVTRALASTRQPSGIGTALMAPKRDLATGTVTEVFTGGAASGARAGGGGGAGGMSAAGIAGGLAAGAVAGVVVGLVIKAIEGVVKAIVDFHRYMVSEATRLMGFSGAASQAVAAEQVAEVMRTMQSAQSGRGAAAASAQRADTFLSNQTARLGDNLLPQLAALTTVATISLGALLSAANTIIETLRGIALFAGGVYGKIGDSIADAMRGTAIGEGLRAILAMLRNVLASLGLIVNNTQPSADMSAVNGAIRADLAQMGAFAMAGGRP